MEQETKFAITVTRVFKILLRRPVPPDMVTVWSHLNFLIKNIDNRFDTESDLHSRLSIKNQILDYLRCPETDYPYPASAEAPSARIIKTRVGENPVRKANFANQVEQIFTHTQNLREITAPVEFVQATYRDGCNTAVVFPELLPGEYQNQPGFPSAVLALITLAGMYKNLDTIRDLKQDYAQQETRIPPSVSTYALLAYGIISRLPRLAYHSAKAVWQSRLSS